MTNGERVQQALNIDDDCVDVWGENGKMFFSVTQEWWYKESGNEGEWLDDGFCGDCVCSVCKQEFDCDIANMRGFDFSLPKFCPNCGARMR